MSRPKADQGQRPCPQCKKRKGVEKFECLPIDDRCNECVPEDRALMLADAREERAKRKFAQIIDSVNAPKDRAPALESLLGGIFSTWGGANTFCHDLVHSLKSRLEERPGDREAIQAMLSIVKLAGRNDQMKAEDDFRQLTTAQLKVAMLREMKALERLAIFNEAKPALAAELREAAGLPPEPISLIEDHSPSVDG